MSESWAEYVPGPGRYREPAIPPGDFYAYETPNYPPEWTRDQRLCAYWFALGHNIKVQSTHAWHAVLVDAERTAERHRRKVTAIRESE
jgi:hypothetical protein